MEGIIISLIAFFVIVFLLIFAIIAVKSDKNSTAIPKPNPNETDAEKIARLEKKIKSQNMEIGSLRAEKRHVDSLRIRGNMGDNLAAKELFRRTDIHIK
jgi:hypothetical protein